LLEGCWDVFEGQYFDHWDPERMVAKRATAAIEDWWTFWVGVDYGFNVSQAAAYLFARSPSTPEHPGGVTYVVEEYCAKHQQAADFALELAHRFQGHGRRIAAWYLSPDAWSERGDGHTLADQMMKATSIGFEQASNDRLGGAMLIYTQLDRGELVVCDGCRQLREALPTRIHDPRRPDDILKIAGDPLDDCVDALRYGVYSFIRPPRLNREAELAQSVTSADATIAALQRRVAEDRLQHGISAHYGSRRTNRRH
ncbi:MAG: hypothetical protein ACRD1E_03115, partial [Terriglobales bacterium]